MIKCSLFLVLPLSQVTLVEEFLCSVWCCKPIKSSKRCILHLYVRVVFWILNLLFNFIILFVVYLYFLCKYTLNKYCYYSFLLKCNWRLLQKITQTCNCWNCSLFSTYSSILVLPLIWEKRASQTSWYIKLRCFTFDSVFSNIPPNECNIPWLASDIVIFTGCFTEVLVATEIYWLNYDASTVIIIVDIWTGMLMLRTLV